MHNDLWWSCEQADQVEMTTSDPPSATFQHTLMLILVKLRSAGFFEHHCSVFACTDPLAPGPPFIMDTYDGCGGLTFDREKSLQNASPEVRTTRSVSSLAHSFDGHFCSLDFSMSMIETNKAEGETVQRSCRQIPLPIAR
jgi:hypothetical protein